MPTSRPSAISDHWESVGIGWAGPAGGGVAIPVPLNAALCGLPTAFDATLTAPLRAPNAVGVNVTLIVHVAEGASVAPQEFPWAKSPEAAMLAMLRIAPPMFCKVSACDAEVVPTNWLPKVSGAGVSDTAGDDGGAAPVPPSSAACGLPAAFDATLIAPLRAPRTVGVNVTSIVHVADGASVAPQEFVCAKSPDATMLAMLSVAPPVFCKVSDCAAEVVPTGWLPNASGEGVNETPGAGGPEATNSIPRMVSRPNMLTTRVYF